jgi:lysophospholipase L1-like esterase
LTPKSPFTIPGTTPSTPAGMKRRAARWLSMAALAGTLLAGCGGGGSSGSSETPAGPITGTNGVIRIMPMGDSVTVVSYRGQLWDLLAAGGYKNVDYVGPAQTGAASADPDHAAFGAYKVLNVLRPAGSGSWSVDRYDDARDLGVWFDNYVPDVVLLHHGTDDAWGAAAPADVMRAYSAIVNYARSKKPGVTFLVAQLIPLFPSDCGTGCNDSVVRINNAIPAWAASITTAQSRVLVVDQYTGFVPGTMTNDGVHPNDLGSQFMAKRWYDRLVTLIAHP